MKYRAVGNRCAINSKDIDFPWEYSMKYVVQFLKDIGFQVLDVDLIEIARAQIGRAKYKRGSYFHEAPSFFDCSGFIKWLYTHMGIWLPRRSIQQVLIGEEVALPDIKLGDLIFTSGPINYYHSRPGDTAIGHVAMVSGEGSVIHAAGKEKGVVETPIEKFVKDDEYIQAIRRVTREDTLILQVPTDREIEWSDDIRWVVRQNSGIIIDMIGKGPEAAIEKKYNDELELYSLGWDGC